MGLRLIAVGNKLPSHMVQLYEHYRQRLPKIYHLELIEIPPYPRHKPSAKNKAILEEGQQILKQVRNQDLVVALAVSGQNWNSVTFAHQLERWQQHSPNICFLIGGPDGLSTACQKRATWHWSLSPLTLPHGLARIFLIEQIYRAWAILTHHPYHR